MPRKIGILILCQKCFYFTFALILFFSSRTVAIVPLTGIYLFSMTSLYHGFFWVVLLLEVKLAPYNSDEILVLHINVNIKSTNKIDFLKLIRFPLALPFG